MKTKENEKRDKYLDLARELKMLRNMKVSVIPVIIGALGTIPEGFVRAGAGRVGNRRTSRDHLNFNL